jgi:hypothetical protein
MTNLEHKNDAHGTQTHQIEQGSRTQINRRATFQRSNALRAAD